MTDSCSANSGNGLTEVGGVLVMVILTEVGGVLSVVILR